MTQEAKLNWKHLDLTSGQSQEMEGQRLANIFAAEFEEDLNEQKALAKEMLATGDLVAVQSVELWTKDPETGEADQLILREHFSADIPKEQSDMVKAKILAEEMTINALRDLFH